MDHQPPLIACYTDREALEDGVLVAFPGEGRVNRVTRAVFDHFTKRLGSSPLTGSVTDITLLQEAIRAMLKVESDEDGWRVGSYQEKELWLVPNEVGGFTLLFPDDY